MELWKIVHDNRMLAKCAFVLAERDGICDPVTGKKRE